MTATPCGARLTATRRTGRAVARASAPAPDLRAAAGAPEEELGSMARSPWWSRTALIAGATIVFAACGSSTATPSPAATEAPATEAPATEAPASEAPYEGMSYPESGDAPCATDDYTGQFKRITAVDRRTVEFQLCYPNVAFLAQVAFTALAIDDAQYLTTMARTSRPGQAQRHRPVQAQDVGPRQPDDVRRQRRLLGREGDDAEPRVPLERPVRPAPGGAAVGHRSTASTTPARTTSPRSRATPT